MAPDLDLIDRIKRDFGEAVVPSCKEFRTQKIMLGPGFQRHVVIKGEKFGVAGPALAKEKRCDCIVVAERETELWLAVVEMKSGSKDVAAVIKKIENCHRRVIGVLSAFGKSVGKKVEVRFAVYSEGRWAKEDFTRLQKWNKKKNAPAQIRTCKFNQKLEELFF